MKGKKCIGSLILCITCLLSLNLFSNASAVDYTVDLTPLRIISSGGFDCSWKYGYENNWTSVQCPMTLPSSSNANDLLYDRYVSQIYTRNEISIEKDKYYELNFFIIVPDETRNPIGVITNFVSSIDDNFSLVNIKQNIRQTDTTDQISTTTINGETYSGDLTLYPMQTLQYSVLLKARRTGNYKIGIGREPSIFITIKKPTYSPLNRISITPYYFIYEYELSANTAEEESAEKELEDRDNLESQSTSTDNQANSAGQSAETTGTTLFAAFSQFFNALTNVSGASCVLPNMQVYSLNLGQMDLCTYDIPPQIMALVSIGMVFIIVPLGIHLVKRMLSLYKEITG